MNRWVLLVLLLGITAGLYAPALNYGFINYDDPHYITRNDNLKPGLSLEGLEWAFTTLHVGYWQPMTWISFLVDVSLFGFESAWGYHFTNILFHVANTALLYWILCRWFGSPGWAFFGAGLFALHPLRVESVVWVTERKDVLSTFFAFLSILSYERWAREGGWRWMLVTALLLTLGLMSKPMLVTMPIGFLLLDYWPLGRWKADGFWRLVLEKWLLGVIAGAFSVVTFWAQYEATAVLSLRLVSRPHPISPGSLPIE